LGYLGTVFDWPLTSSSNYLGQAFDKLRLFDKLLGYAGMVVDRLTFDRPFVQVDLFDQL
jgi:hypothetical protein